jgi:uncharacterized protein YraI
MIESLYRGMTMRKLLHVGAALAVMGGPALAANGSTTESVQLQAGPGSQYPDVMRLAAGLKVEIHGCSAAWDWCDITWRGNRGWVLATSLSYHSEAGEPSTSLKRESGLPTATFNLEAYWNTHYAQRPWFADRDAWRLTEPGTVAGVQTY